VDNVITAPLPAVEEAEEPIKFVATIRAHTLDPVLNEKGVDIKVCTVIVQLLDEMIVDKVPSQLGNT
jgi:hypothetical protein